VNARAGGMVGLSFQGGEGSGSGGEGAGLRNSEPELLRHQGLPHH